MSHFMLWDTVSVFAVGASSFERSSNTKLVVLEFRILNMNLVFRLSDSTPNIPTHRSMTARWLKWTTLPSWCYVCMPLRGAQIPLHGRAIAGCALPLEQTYKLQTKFANQGVWNQPHFSFPKNKIMMNNALICVAPCAKLGFDLGPTCQQNWQLSQSPGLKCYTKIIGLRRWTWRGPSDAHDVDGWPSHFWLQHGGYPPAMSRHGGNKDGHENILTA